MSINDLHTMLSGNAYEPVTDETVDHRTLPPMDHMYWRARKVIVESGRRCGQSEEEIAQMVAGLRTSAEISAEDGFDHFLASARALMAECDATMLAVRDSDDDLWDEEDE